MKIDKPPVEFPEVAGKSVTDVTVHDDALYGREVLIRFTDGTQLSIQIEFEQKVRAVYSMDDLPESPLWSRQA